MTLDYANPIDTLTFRFASALGLMLIPVCFGFFKLKYRGKPLIPLFLLATMYPVGFFTLQAFGLQHATSSEGGIINAFTPVVTILFASIFLKEVTSLSQKFSMLLSVVGVLLIFLANGSAIDFSKITGTLLLVLACIIFAGYSVFARSISRFFSPAEISFFMIGIGFAISFVVSFINNAFDGTLKYFFTPLSSGTFVWLIVYLGFVQLATALMATYILSKIEASKASVFINLSTVVSIIAGAFYLGEVVTWYHLCGSILIIVGVIGTNRLVKKPVSKNKATNAAKVI